MLDPAPINSAPISIGGGSTLLARLWTGRSGLVGQREYTSGVPRLTPDGTFAGYIGSAMDITERKQAEESLRQTQSRACLHCPGDDYRRARRHNRL